MADFRLDKWYFDCVASDGAVLIGYAARLKWGLTALAYGARVTRPNGREFSQRQSLSFGTVDESDQTIRWANDRLMIEGEWIGGTPIPSTMVVDEPSGHVEWRCLGANCSVNVHVDGRPMTGTGYAEKLSMTVPPWKLPFTELRWGRYISDDREDFMVWTDLRGVRTRTWVWLNGGEAVAGTVHDAGVSTDVAELEVGSSQAVRGDNVARTLLGRLEFLKNALPEGVRAIEEHKQVSACVLRAHGAQSRGSSIHEVVKWR